MPKKVLLVDTNFSSRPIYDAILNMGYEVHVVGGNPNDALAKTAENYWELDYSNVDKLKELVGREGFDFIVPGCTDRSYTSCVMVSEERFPGIESLDNDQTINLKHKYRALGKTLGLEFPRLYTAELDESDFPVIVKPVDSFSGKGITIVEHSSTLDDAINFAKVVSPTGRYIVEEYVDGQLYSHSAFIENRSVSADFIVKEDSSINPFAVDTSSLCSQFESSLLQTLRSSIESIAKKLRLLDGLVHTQFILKDGCVCLIEMTRRCPGDLYSQLIELQTGFPYVENYIRPFLGLALDTAPSTDIQRYIVRHTLSSNDEIIYNGVRFLQPITLSRWVPLRVTGDVVLPSPYGRVGVSFIDCHNEAATQEIYRQLMGRALYVLY
ncbi:acetyl-CoA carboxylase biotin carboxylase subunit family protein [Neptuniibacter sp. 2_MG-2023]|uniref:ATP-grasp domain-containing protein n=1 Tax=Neptuniibacter sp. 2_MG-2023 TaxID=3062671 RepID=UPI0026E1D95B|nr:ATP-grasp domain-containing protein [Neptuniibacter sp. 2_MG-2023]MDO6514524.1 ATP-grasp domain-containing protein [Neptuniibacter sp. 2_MG-2023]